MKRMLSYGFEYRPAHQEWRRYIELFDLADAPALLEFPLLKGLGDYRAFTVAVNDAAPFYANPHQRAVLEATERMQTMAGGIESRYSNGMDEHRWLHPDQQGCFAVTAYQGRGGELAFRWRVLAPAIRLPADLPLYYTVDEFRNREHTQ